MECPECRASNRQDAKFCARCGNALWPATCPQCRTEALAGAHFCVNCGAPLRDSQEQTQLRVGSGGSRDNRQGPSITFGAADGERKFISVLFVDAANYTAMADVMDPEDLQNTVAECFEMLHRLVVRSGGIVTAFSGDGMMALFGAPTAVEDHAQRACYSALSIQTAMTEYTAHVREKFGVEFAVRIGVNSGTAIVGTMGHGYTAFGDMVNVCSRLQSLADPGTVVASRETFAMVCRNFEFEDLGPRRVKGKRQEIEAYRLIGPIKAGPPAAAEPDRAVLDFIGRTPELGRLNKAFERVLSGSGQVVALVGEAGVGKSRLLREFRGGLGGRDHTYLEGECLNFGSPIAYLPIAGILRTYFGIREGTREFDIKRCIEAKVAGLGLDCPSLVPPLLELFSITGDSAAYLALDPKQRRERIFEVVRDIVTAMSEEKPLVLAVENLLWVDRSSEELLAYLVPRLLRTRILLILVYRREYRPSFEDSPRFVSILLRGLDETEVPLIIDSLLGGAKANEQVRDLILTKAQGNPLFIEELTRTLKESGHIEEEHGEYVAKKDFADIAIPDSIQGIIAARMDGLSEGSRRVLQTAAVIGKSFALVVLRKVIGPGVNLDFHLLELQSADFLLPKPNRGEARYEFRHDLLQEVAYRSLLARKSRELHEAVGAALESAYAEEAYEFYEICAYHFEKSGNIAKAYRYLRLSGDKATQNSSLGEGFRYYKRALDILKESETSLVPPREELELYSIMAPPMISIGFPEDSLDILREGESLARKVNSTRHIATLSSMVGLCYSVRGELREGRRYTEECFKAAESTDDIEIIAPTAFDLCSNYAAQGEFLKVRQVAERVTAQIEKGGRRFDSFDRGYNVYAALLGFWGFGEGYLGRFPEGESLCRRGLEFSAEIQNVSSLAMIETCYGYILAHRGSGSEAIPHFVKSIKYLEKGNISVLLGLAWSGLGWAHYFVGRTESALNYVERGISIHSEAGIGYKSSVPYWFLSQIHLDRGEREIARECAEKALDRARKNDELYMEGISRILLGATIEATDRFQEAEDHLLKGTEILERLGIKPFCAIGNMYLSRLYKSVAMEAASVERLGAARGVMEKAGMSFWLGKLLAPFPMNP